MYPDQFDKIGSIPGAVRLSIKKNIHPHIDAPRKTPIALKDYIKQELDNMVKNKIIRKETKADPVLDQLQRIIKAGWPDSIKDLPPVIRSYWPYRDELSVNDGIIMKDSRIIIPETQQKIILDQLHHSHQGVEKTRLQARDAVYWERINADIENMTKYCSICQENLPAQPKEILQPHDIPSRAWEVVGTDLFNCNNHEYLIIADYFSKFPIIRKMNGLTTSNLVISTMKQVFSEHNLPSPAELLNNRILRSNLIVWGEYVIWLFQ